MINRLCIIGVGLIGGSLALALRRAGYVNEVVGSGRNEANLRKAVDLKVIDHYESNPARAVKAADMVVLAVPLGAMQSVCELIAASLPSGAILTDAGSAKASVVEAVRISFGALPEGFVPGHPIAGTEQSGVEAAFAELYDHRRVILTPTKRSSVTAIDKVRAMWENAGAIVEETSVDHHDKVLAATSHLPHMLAFGLVDCLARMGDHDEIFRYAAGGFRDFTRIASSDPVMWRDICISNREPLLKMIERYQEDLKIIAAAIDRKDDAVLLEIFTRAKKARDSYVIG